MGYIFESDIISIINTVRAKTIGVEDGIVLKRVLTADIHPAIKAYFKAEVEKILSQERGLEHRSKRLPYSLPEAVSLQQRIDMLLVQNYHFGRQECESLLDESVHFQFNYLCRPQWTLLNFIVGEQRRVASEIIEKRLRYCVDYRYFPEIIGRYIVDHGLAEVTYEEFKSLLERIDREVMAQHSSLELAHMTRALFEFVESGKMEPSAEFEKQTLPVNAAVVFFDDKQRADIRTRLEFERDHNALARITADRLADIIEIVRTGDERATAAPAHPPDSASAEERQEKTDAGRASAVAADEPYESGETVVERSGGIPEPGSGPAAEENESRASGPILNEKQNVLINLFHDDERVVLIEKLLAGNEDAFLTLMSEIGGLQTWEEIAHYLDALFLAYDVDPFNPAAVMLTDRLFTHFNSPAAGSD
jgi:hypothetical protein